MAHHVREEVHCHVGFVESGLVNSRQGRRKLIREASAAASGLEMTTAWLYCFARKDLQEA